ncbi:MAG: helicase HerA-like domain-containing protein [Saprospiraceae bacterium]
MQQKEKFLEALTTGYTFKGASIFLGAPMLNGECMPEAPVKAPLRMFNRHGLISGATGTGKTKTLQVLAEQLSASGVPVLMMDVKGDLSGIAVPGVPNARITERHEKIGYPFVPADNPVEFLSLSDEKGVRLRATVTEFGPVLLSRLMELSDAQSGILAAIFQYCDDNDIPLVDLEDLRRSIQYITGPGKAEVEAKYGAMSSVSSGTILRKIVELEQQGADKFFGEPSFDVDDLCRFDDKGRGIISIVRLTDIQSRPKLFSTFMLQLLAEIYSTFPEEGDPELPKLVLFIDEAHLIFEEATEALLDQIEVIMKLIRSKGVGVFFITQNPVDVPDAVLGQLGMKVQHALRAFTAKDRKAIKLAAENFPVTEYYAVDELLTQLGTGEALVTVLNEKGIPTPLAYTLLRAPQSRMDILSEEELSAIVRKSQIAVKYKEQVDRESAKEILHQKMEVLREEENAGERRKALEQANKASSRTQKGERSFIEEIIRHPTTREVGRTVARELTRSLLSVLGVRSSRRR